MKILYLLFFLFVSFAANAQNPEYLKTEPNSIEGNLLNDTKAIAILLMSTSKKEKSNVIKEIKDNPNSFSPPVLYNLSSVLFGERKYNEACYWFYVAQLRARYDVNRSADKRVSAADWNQPIGLVINQYALEHLDTLKKIIPKVIEFVSANEETYEQRWINVIATNYVSHKDSNNDNLSVDRSEWPAIKKSTIDIYYSDFKEQMEKLNKK
jgi:hypothetical protein